MRRKNNSMKRLAAVSMAIVMACSAMGCQGTGGKSKGGVDSNGEALVIGAPKLGYGTAWTEALAEAYTEKTGNPVTVKIDPPDINYVAMIQSGTGDYDIYLTRVAAQQILKSMGDKDLLVDMTELYKKKNPYDDNQTTIEEKLKEGYRRYNEYVETDGSIHYYGLQYVDSIQQIVRNLDVWNESWPEPRTTDELLELCEIIKKDNCTPFIWCAADSYWQNFYPVWVYQYQGYEDMIEFWSGTSPEGEKLSADMWNRTGWLKTLEVMEELLLPENEYQDAYSRSVDFTSAQSYFISGNRNIAMMVNGDWLVNEMAKNYPNANLEMMKTPVLSAIIEVLPGKSVSDDAELRALIAAIDDKNTSLSGSGYEVTQEDYDYVKECRTYYPNLNGHHQFLIPVNAKHKDVAEDFLQFCASDEGMMIMAESSGGFLAPYQYTEEQIAKIKADCDNDFVRSALDLRDGEMVATNMFRSNLFTLGGLKPVPNFNMSGTPEVLLSDEGAGYMDAKTIFNKNLGNVRSAWSTITTKAGYR